MNAIVVECVIGLLYTGEISIDIDNLEQFVKVALYLSVTYVQSILCSFMIDTLNLDTCIKYYFVAKEYLLGKVEEKAGVMLKSRFHDCIIFKESCSEISPDQMLLLMRQLDIFANCSVEDILQFVSKWAQIGSTVSHENTGCLILDYVRSRVKDTNASFVSSDFEEDHSASDHDFPTSFRKANFHFEKKLKEVQNLVSCEDFSVFSPIKDVKNTNTVGGQSLTTFEGEKPKENQFQIKTEFDDILIANELGGTVSYLEKSKHKNYVKAALVNMLCTKQIPTNKNVDSEVVIYPISTELTNNISGKMLQTSDQGLQAVEQYECTICEKKYKRKWGLVHHVNLVHGRQIESAQLPVLQKDDPETICKYCGKHILHKENMKRHLKLHTFDTGKQHTCKICEKSFKFKDYLKQHMRVVHCKEKTHTCFVCKERFCRNSELKLHLSKHTGEIRHVCSVCGVSFKQKRNLITHRKKHDNQKQTSSSSNTTKTKASTMECDKIPKVKDKAVSDMATQSRCTQTKFDNPEDCNEAELNKHNRKVKEHRSSKTESFILDSVKSTENFEKLSNLYKTVTKLKMRKSECDICGKVVKPHNLKRHFQIHTAEYTHTCSVCQKKFKFKDNLVQHMVSHGERKYPCPVCKKLFLRTNEGISHMATHTGEKRFFCHVNGCGKGFYQKMQLLNHERKHTGVKATHPTVPCPVCKRSIIKYALRRHMATHSDEKAFMCETCGRQFKGRNALKEHIRLHKSGINKPVSCKLCTRRFNWNSSLYKHMITKHGVGKQSHQCSVCGKQFSWRFYLSTHMLIHNDEKRHTCVTCGRGFKAKSALNRHRRMHTGEKNYVCSICTKCFTRQENLTGHIKRYHK